MDQNVIEIAERFAEKVKSYILVKMIVIYGSYLKGTADENSDIDISVVVDNIEGDYLKISAELFNLVRDINKKIEPILLSTKKDKSGFLENILKHGKIVYKSEG
ncbi:MAG: nucleotidyltransferase domain-containing protein [bacterium]